MTRPDWDATFMRIADAYASRSKCTRRQVGAVIVSSTNEQIAAGYNGAPASYRPAGQHGECSWFCPRSSGTPSQDYGNCVTIHAEMNALLRVDRRDMLEGGTVYITTSSCWDCAKVLSNTRIRRVVMRLDRVRDAHRDPDRVVQLLEKCDKEVQLWESWTT